MERPRAVRPQLKRDSLGGAHTRLNGLSLTVMRPLSCRSRTALASRVEVINSIRDRTQGRGRGETK